MQKKKVFEIADSNIEGIGSKQDKQIKEAAAGGEKAWAKVPKDKPCRLAWRIEKFKVKANAAAINGTFFDDDSYIFLHGYKTKGDDEKGEDKLAWDLFFWLGNTTTQDEYGTAAYKVVELDTYLGDVPVQYREISGAESSRFLKLFDKCGLKVLQGGVESGFNKVKPTEYEPKLLHVKGRGKRLRVKEVDILVSSLNDGDIFILDGGMDLYCYQGKKANMHEKNKGSTIMQSIDDDRSGKPEKHVFGQCDDIDEDIQKFWSYFQEDLGGKNSEYKVGEPVEKDVCLDLAKKIEEDKKLDTEVCKSVHALYRLSDGDGDGELSLSEKSKGKDIVWSHLDTNDVFILDFKERIWIWMGKKASKEERLKGYGYANTYCKKVGRPANLPVALLKEGHEPYEFLQGFSDKKKKKK